jgi:hypothetical protein
VNITFFFLLSFLKEEDLVESGNLSAIQSSSPSLDGLFISAQQLLDLVKNQKFISA